MKDRIYLIIIVISSASKLENMHSSVKQITTIKKCYSYLSDFAPSEPTLRHVCALVEPRPVMPKHLAPRNVLPSLQMIENGSCDLMALKEKHFLNIFNGEYKKHVISKKI